MYVNDMAEYAKLNQIYCDVFNHPNPPSRACVEVPLMKQYPVILEATLWSKVSTPTGDISMSRYSNINHS